LLRLRDRTKRHVRIVSRVLLLCAALIYGLTAIGCTKVSSTGPEPVSDRLLPDDAVPWRTAWVFGERPQAAVVLFEQAWPRVQARFGIAGLPDWRIELWATPIPCGGATVPNGTLPSGTFCRGLTWEQRLIQISWINGPDDVAAVAEWEFCNAARLLTTGKLEDRGCT